MLYSRFPLAICFTHGSVYMSIPISQSINPPFTYLYPHVFSLCQGLYSCLGNRFIYTIIHFSLSCIGEGSDTPLQYSCLENPMDQGAWCTAVHGVAKSRTRPSEFISTFHFHALEKEMATHSSVLAWRIPGTGEPGGLPSAGSHRVGHD